MPPPTWTPPSEFEEYRLVRRLGFGSMGQVFLAQDLVLDRRVAIKFIGSAAQHPSVKERFLTEARAVARLAHPNVVTVHRVGTLEGQPYMVSELIDGDSLDRLPRPVAPAQVARIAVDLARGLAAAHRAGILHRDVKPANAMWTRDGAAKLLDFGLAKLGDGSDAAPAGAHAAAKGADPDATPQPTFDADATHASPSGPTARDGAAEAVSPAALTQQGAVLGTPLYMAPECWRGEAASRRSDVYSLGALLYELCAGQPPARYLSGTTLRDAVVGQDPRPLLEVAPQTEPGLAAAIDRCLARDASLRFGSGDEVREALERSTTQRPAVAPGGNPYRGLAAFEAEHRACFFGRDAETREACDRLRSGGLVVVAGESGVGKSSVCRAGVVPAVVGGALGDGRAWRSAVSLPGRRPLKSLVAACASALQLDADAMLARALEHPPALAREVLQALGRDAGLLVFVDQLEEWVTFADPQEAALAARALAALGEGLPGLRVLATARTDLLSKMSALPGLGRELSASLLLLTPVQPEHLRQVVAGPAEAAGARFESLELVATLADFAAQGGALPALQFALARLWEAKDGDVLTEAALSAMGGVSGALARHADGVVLTLPAQQRDVAQRLLVGLVSGEDQRQRRVEAELLTAPGDADVLATLARARLVLARDSAEGTVWELAHEALLREWPTLRRWLTENADTRLWRQRLSAAVAEWERLGRGSEALWGGRQLAVASGVLLAQGGEAAPAVVMTAAQRDFLSRSRRWAQLRRWRVPLAALALLAVGAITFAGVRWRSGSQAAGQVEARLTAVQGHLASGRAAQAQTVSGRAAAFRAFDAGDFEEGERLWAQAVAAQSVWRRALGLAQAEWDAAQVLLPTYSGLKPRLLELAAQRVGHAEVTGAAADVAADALRLRSLGATDEELAALSHGAALVVSFEPKEAVARWTPDAEGSATQTLVSGGRLEVEAGASTLTLFAQGFHAVSLPLWARAGETQAVTVRLLPSSSVPEGFVHVPAGWSLVGSGADEGVRREFYDAAPLHRVFVDDFLVGQREVTFGEWMAFLESLPAERRPAHTPRVDSSVGAADTGAVRLTKDAAGWAVSLVPVSRRYQARAGAPLRYQGRTRNAEQPWETMPVVGISPVDVEAYAVWLDQSGRVPGARPCTEYEWERAARGADGRTLPHGEAFTPDDANIDETYGRQDEAYGADAAGLHPVSRSPFGLDDVLGNVWEIVRPASSQKPWALKGGSWQANLLSARIPNQWVVNAGYRQVETGVRMCASVRR